MKRNRHPIRSDARATAKTGEDIFDPDESVIASDTGLQNSQTTMGPIVGRTGYDLLYEGGITGAAAKLLYGIDVVELLGTTAYVLLRLFSKPDVPIMRVWVFLGLLAGYHVIVKPLESLLWSYVEQLRRRIAKKDSA